MTDAEKLVLITAMTGETDQSVLSAYLILARQIVLEKAYPYGNAPETFPSQYDGVQVEICAYMLNKRGAEGETVHLENGVSRHWEDGGVSPSLLRRITPFVSVMSLSSSTETEESEEETTEEESENETNEEES